MENSMAHPGGRPTDYTPELLERARGYLGQLKPDVYDEVSKTWDLDLPSIASFAGYIGLSRETVHTWAKDPEKKEFSDIYLDILRKQEEVITRGSMGGKYNPTITKLLLTKHGYSDKTETDITTLGEKLESAAVPAPIVAKAVKAYEDVMRESIINGEV